MSRAFEPFSVRFGGALTARQMSLSELRSRLIRHGNPMSISALSYWRSGDRKPEGAKSMAAVADIEMILGLEAGALSSLIPPSARGGSAPPRYFTDGVEPLADAIDGMALSLMTDSIYSGREISTHITADVDAHGDVLRQAHRIRLQAVTTPITELVWAEIPPEPTDIAPVFTAVAGCRIAQTLSQPGGDGFAALFALDRTVEVGQTTVVEFRMEFPTGYPRLAACEHLTSRKTRELMLWVRFTPDTLPLWIEETEIVAGVTRRIARQVDGLAVHAERTGFPPGLLSLRWGYEA